MFRFIITMFISFIFNNSWADCDVTSKFNINVTVSPVKYDYSKTSNEIKRIPNIKTSNESQYLLGAYIPLLSVGLNYQNVREQYFSHTCNKIATMNVNLKLESTIFIAKEIQPFSCTLNRTIQHENSHYTFEKQGVEVGVEYLRKSLEPVFSQKFYGSPNEFNQFMKNQMDVLQRNTLNLVENYSGKRHAAIDTTENYRKESQLCSSAEQQMIARSILPGY